MSRSANSNRAEALLVRALSPRREGLRPEHIEPARDRHNLANLYLLRRDHTRAEPRPERVAAREKTLGPEPRSWPSTLTARRDSTASARTYARATALVSRAIAIARRRSAPQHPQVGFALNNLAALAHERATTRAPPRSTNARLKSTSARSAAPPDTATLLNNLAILREASGRPKRRSRSPRAATTSAKRRSSSSSRTSHPSGASSSTPRRSRRDERRRLAPPQALPANMDAADVPDDRLRRRAARSTR